MASVEPRKARKPRKPLFYVVQFRELPYDHIDGYVCVPHTWVSAPAVAYPKVVVAYPNNEAPLITRNRVKRKEKKGYKWRYYMAVAKYDSDFYDDAILWIVQQNNFGSSQKRNSKDLSSSSALNKENKPELGISMKRPAISASTEQLNNKRPKLETVVRTVDVQTNSNPASCFQHFSHQHPSSVPRLDGLQNSATQQHYLDVPHDAQSPNESHGTNQRTTVKKERVNETFLQPQRKPVPKQLGKYPSRFDRSENQDIVKQVPRDSIGTNYYDDCPLIKLSASARDLQANALNILQYISKLAQQQPKQTSYQDSQQPSSSSTHIGCSKRQLPVSYVAAGSNTIKRSTAVQCSMSASKTPLAGRDVATGNNTIDRSMVAQCSMSASITPLASRDIATGCNTIGRPMVVQSSTTTNQRQLPARYETTGSNTTDRPIAALSSTIIRQRQLPARYETAESNTTDRSIEALSSTTTRQRQLPARYETAESNTTDRPMAALSSTTTSQRQLPARYETAESNTTDRPMAALSSTTPSQRQLPARYETEIVLKLKMLDNMIATYTVFDKRMKSNLHYVSLIYDNLRMDMNKMSEQVQSVLGYRNHLKSSIAKYSADTGSGAT